MKISLTRDVKAPERGTEHSAGLDFFVPVFNKQFQADFIGKNKSQIESNEISISSDELILKPHSRVLIPAGVHVNLEELTGRMVDQDDESVVDAGLALIVHNKSGVGSKKGLDRLAEVIDQDYQGEIHLNVVNTSNELQVIKPGDKLVQMIILPVIYSRPEVVPFDELYNSNTERGEGGFGSTDKK
jgi:deoxyuridine 5'-triphosphate nucleotidohydrolase